MLDITRHSYVLLPWQHHPKSLNSNPLIQPSGLRIIKSHISFCHLERRGGGTLTGQQCFQYCVPGCRLASTGRGEVKGRMAALAPSALQVPGAGARLAPASSRGKK